VRSSLSFALAALVLFVLPSYSTCQSQSSADSPAPLELVIDGPGLIHVGQTLVFKVFLTNRSSKPVAVAQRVSGSIFSTFRWKIVDARDEELPRATVKDPRVFCPLSSPLGELEVRVLQPGEKLVYRQAGDPSDYYAFPGKGVYRVTLRYTFQPPRNFGYEASMTPQERMSAALKDAFATTPDVDITSNIHIVILQ
jgi:hypothetical protein